MNPISGLNATFAAGMAKAGSVGFVSQSGALLTAVLDWSAREGVGFSSVVSLGSMLDVGWGDVIYYLGDDPHTESIVIYMETIGDARSFLSAAREVALTKPIIVIKPGRTAEAARAAASHTGSLTGSDEVLAAAFRRVGVLRVDRISDLFGMAEVLAKQPRPAGPRLTIVTNAGGPGVIATDALVAGGGRLAELAPETMAALDAVLPPTWSHNNPIDIIGDAPPERYAKALEIAARDPGLRRPPRHPHAPGDDRPDPDGRGADGLRPDRRQARPRLLDGRRRGGGRGDHPPAGRDPDLRLPGHGGRDVQLPLALGPGSPSPLRDAVLAGRRRAGRRPGPGGSGHRGGPGGGADAPDRSRIEGGPLGLRDPDHRDAGRPDRGGGGGRGRGDRLPGRRQALQPHDHPQDRRRRASSSTSTTPPPSGLPTGRSRRR
ncbi:MAG: hypothetical protein KatS3mg065_0133 [Chloroflexota bacterium]|nr:MAG: hypothetical protein KatS3mg065_0133 [Chloroflexota bacterium]